jgi:hypothetical protein
LLPSIYRNLIECAALCSTKSYCSAFCYDKDDNICQFGTQDNLQAQSPAVAGSIIAYINPSFVKKGNFLHFQIVTVLKDIMM